MASRKKHFWKVIWSEVIHKSNNYYTPQNHMQPKKISSYTLLRILLTPTRIFTGGCTHSKIFHERHLTIFFYFISFLTYYSLEILEKLRHIIDVKQYRDSIISRDPKWAPSIWKTYLVVYLCLKKSFAASFIAFSGVIKRIFTADPRYIPLNPSAR